MQLSANAIQVLEKRYLAKNKDGKVIESVEDMFARVARTAAGAEKDECITDYADRFYKIMTNLEFLPNSPTLINAGRELGQLSACIGAGTLVYCKDGLKPIEEIKIGDEVLTHRMRFKRVTNTWYKGKKQTINCARGTKHRKRFSLCCTSDHKILSKNIWTPSIDAKSGDVPTLWQSELEFPTLHTLVYTDIINKRVYNNKYSTKKVIIKNNKIHLKNKDKRNRSGEFDKSENEIYANVHNSNKIAFLFGLYLAEGCTAIDNLRFTLSKKEKKLAHKVLYYMASEFNARGGISYSNNGDWLNINFNSRWLVHLFNKHMGNGKYIKRLPHWTPAAPTEYKLALFRGLMVGDGHRIDNGYRLCLANPTLVYETLLLGRELGYYCSFTPNARGKLSTHDTSLATFTKTHYTHNLIKKEHTIQDVYDIEVEEDHSFVAGDFIVHNCFVLPLEDSMESIFTTLRDAAIIQKSGGGCGFSFSNIRPCNDLVKSTNKCAGGPVAFIRIFDRALDVIKQGGVRHGANMAVLRVDHPDIISFIRCKEIEGDIPNFNISVGITDEFMSAVKAGAKYQLINPRSGAVTEEIDANGVFNLIIDHAWNNGEPGLLFLDEMNRHNPTPHMGLIEATNPCGEQPLLGYESCNLGSINLGRMVKAGKVDWDRLEYVVRTSVRFLDNIIDMNRYPIGQIETKTKSTRKIGLGVMGFADALIKLDLTYDTDEAIRFAREVMRFIHLAAIKKSEVLAQQRGVFPAYRGSKWQTEDGIRVRNAALTTIAPTGTLSILANCSSGIEPYYSKSVKKHILNTILEEEIEFAKSDCFITAHEIAPEWHVKVQAAFQPYIDSAVSKTINFPEDATREDIRKAYFLAYKLRCKGITVYRDNSRVKQVLVKDKTDTPITVKVPLITECPDCKAPVIFDSGCQKCSNEACGWSACRIAVWLLGIIYGGWSTLYFLLEVANAICG